MNLKVEISSSKDANSLLIAGWFKEEAVLLRKIANVCPQNLNANKLNSVKATVENPENNRRPTQEIVNKTVDDPTMDYTEDKDFILVRG